jgi:acyl-coenzyme A thioesterase PaaI-like protein
MQFRHPLRVLRLLWTTLSRWPGGKWIFSRILGIAVPYTGSLVIDVEELRHGYARATLQDRWRARNHLNSIHAMAIANLAEAVTGLALNFTLEETRRAILTGFEIRYLLKGRGRLTAECTLDRENLGHIEGLVKNAQGEIVAQVKATWKVGEDS